MSNSKISVLTSATTPLAGTEILPVVQSSTTKQVSVANLTAGRAISAASLALTTSPLPVGSGGLGIATTPANGQIPIGNATNYVAATLTAGSGVSITNASGAITIANTQAAGPAFSAYSSNAQSINSGATAKIQLNNKVFDTATAFDATTNYRFTPQVAGYYQINGQVALNGGGVGQARASIFKNGTGYAEGNSVPNNTITGAEPSVATIVYLNGSTDYVELYCYLYTGAGALTLQNSSAVNYFSGAMVRSA